MANKCGVNLLAGVGWATQCQHFSQRVNNICGQVPSLIMYVQIFMCTGIYYGYLVTRVQQHGQNGKIIFWTKSGILAKYSVDLQDYFSHVLCCKSISLKEKVNSLMYGQNQSL